MSTGPIIDQQPTSSEAHPQRKPKIHSRQVGGIPSAYVVPLFPATMTAGAGLLEQKLTGLHVGILCHDDAQIAYHGVLVPDFQFMQAIVRVEFTHIDDIPDNATCSITLTHLDRNGKPHRQVTDILMACGEIASFYVPGIMLDRGTIFAAALAFVPMSFDTADPPKKRPILVRGAWVEFPE
jgi:hypothetical protein